MHETLIGILGGLFGSILTVIVTKYLEIQQKKLEYKAALKKEFFLKKITALEKATGQWYLLISAMGSLSSLFKLLPEDTIIFDENVEASLIKSINDQIDKVSGASYEIANSIFLYFDINDDNLWDFEPLDQILRLYGEIGYLKTQMDLLYNYHIQYRGTHLEKEIEIGMEKVENDTKKKILEISSLFDSIKQSYTSHIKAMRNEMKKYE